MSEELKDSENREILDVVDFDDRKTGTATRKEIHEKGLMHRAVHVLLTDGNGRFLLQKRSEKKQQHPNLWDVSVSGHVDSGEIYYDAAVRECVEEMGVDEVELEQVGGLTPTILNGWEHIHIFSGVISPVVVKPHPVEISDFRWLTMDEYDNEKKVDPDDEGLCMTPASYESMKEWIRVGAPGLIRRQ